MVPGVIASGAVVLLMQLQAWSPLEEMANDQIIRWHGPRAWDSRIVMVSIDDQTLNQLGQFPISRKYYAQLLEGLNQNDSSVVVFNLMLSEEVSADIIAADPITAGRVGAPGRSATTQMARAMSRHGRVVIGQSWSAEGDPIEPIPVLSDTAMAVGHMRLRPDLGGFARQVEMTYRDLPTLGVAAIQAYSLENQLVTIPTDLSLMRINWPGSVEGVTTLSLIDVIKGRISPDFLKDKIIIVGYGATSGFAPMRTPFDSRWPVPGGYMHAAVIDNLLNQSWLRTVSYQATILALLLGGPLFSWLLYRRETLIQVAIWAALSCGWVLASVFALKVNLLLPVVSPLMVMFGTATAVIVWSRLQSNALLQVRSAFLSTMSHEIRTPLNAIVNLSEMLQETSLDERQREYAETLFSSSQTLMALINDVLDFSKIESGRLMLEDYPLRLSDTIERSIELLAPRAAEKEIELAYAIAPSVPNAIVGDPVRLQQILSNLLSNAVKFTASGEVSIRVDARPYRPQKAMLGLPFSRWLPRKMRSVQNRTQNRTQSRIHRQADATRPPLTTPLASAEPGNTDLYEICVSVTDTGIGIPSEKISRLFKPFSQVSSSTTRQYGGTGLGLSICKRLSERMGGDLWVKSSPGRGSTFYFTFHALKTLWNQTSPGFLRALQGTHLLVIDRNQTRREQLSLELEALDIRFVQATSLSEAIVFINNTPTFDGIILDEAVATGAMDVAIAIENLRQAIGNPQLPVVLLSALKSDLPTVAGHVTMLWKPMKQASLHQALHNIRPFRLIAASDPAPKLENQRASLRVLLAEDNRINQRVALRLLELLGYQADVVNSGVEVIAALKKHRYDVILMDMRMPEMDGVQTTRQIRQMPQHKDTWIIAMTANAMAADRQRCFAAGMNDYIRKPIKREVLDQALQRCPAIQRGLAM